MAVEMIKRHKRYFFLECKPMTMFQINLEKKNKSFSRLTSYTWQII